MDISSISTNYTVANADKSAEQSNSLQSSLKNISSDSSEEQLKGVIKDFESYFVEQVIKQMKIHLPRMMTRILRCHSTKICIWIRQLKRWQMNGGSDRRKLYTDTV